MILHRWQCETWLNSRRGSWRTTRGSASRCYRRSSPAGIAVRDVAGCRTGRCCAGSCSCCTPVSSGSSCCRRNSGGHRVASDGAPRGSVGGDRRVRRGYRGDIRRARSPTVSYAVRPLRARRTGCRSVRRRHRDRLRDRRGTYWRRVRVGATTGYPQSTPESLSPRPGPRSMDGFWPPPGAVALGIRHVAHHLSRWNGGSPSRGSPILRPSQTVTEEHGSSPVRPEGLAVQ